VTNDILEGLVAGGTLALAGATTVLAFASRHATREAYWARVDASAPRLVVRSFRIYRVPMHQDPDGGRVAPSEEGAPWDMTQAGDVLLGTRAGAAVVNEGVTSALLRVECPEDVRCSVALDQEHEGRIRRSVPATARDIETEGGWYHIEPGFRAVVTLTWWRSARRWSEIWDASEPPPTRTVTMIVHDTTGSVEDRCDLRFGAYVMMPRPVEDGWMVAGREVSSGVPVLPPDQVVITGLVRRTYSRERHPDHRLWRRKPAALGP
jgi:hypothetical protein